MVDHGDLSRKILLTMRLCPMKKPKEMMKRMTRIRPVILGFSTITGPSKVCALEALNKYEVNTEPNALEKFDESAEQVELKQADDIPGEVENV